MIHIGIDQSMGFTGVTVFRPGAPTEHIFYGITHKKHTKWDKFMKNPPRGFVNRLTVLDFIKEEKSDDYAENERIKYNNLINIVTQIRGIFETVARNFPDDVTDVRMEGVSFGSRATTAIAELSALNYFIRQLCSEFGFEFTILPPTVVKKFATGNGQADKALMTESFLALNPDMRPVHELIKLDDIADSYFMACWSE